MKRTTSATVVHKPRGRRDAANGGLDVSREAVVYINCKQAFDWYCCGEDYHVLTLASEQTLPDESDI